MDTSYLSEGLLKSRLDKPVYNLKRDLKIYLSKNKQKRGPKNPLAYLGGEIPWQGNENGVVVYLNFYGSFQDRKLSQTCG